MSAHTIENRTMAAYCRGQDPFTLRQPSPAEVVEHEGETYAVLSNMHGILAVYRVRDANNVSGFSLRRLESWPKALKGGAA